MKYKILIILCLLLFNACRNSNNLKEYIIPIQIDNFLNKKLSNLDDDYYPILNEFKDFIIRDIASYSLNNVMLLCHITYADHDEFLIQFRYNNERRVRKYFLDSSYKVKEYNVSSSIPYSTYCKNRRTYFCEYNDAIFVKILLFGKKENHYFELAKNCDKKSCIDFIDPCHDEMVLEILKTIKSFST